MPVPEGCSAADNRYRALVLRVLSPGFSSPRKPWPSPSWAARLPISASRRSSPSWRRATHRKFTSSMTPKAPATQPSPNAPHDGISPHRTTVRQRSDAGRTARENRHSARAPGAIRRFQIAHNRQYGRLSITTLSGHRRVESTRCPSCSSERDPLNGTFSRLDRRAWGPVDPVKSHGSCQWMLLSASSRTCLRCIPTQFVTHRVKAATDPVQVRCC